MAAGSTPIRSSFGAHVRARQGRIDDGARPVSCVAANRLGRADDARRGRGLHAERNEADAQQRDAGSTKPFNAIGNLR